MDAEILFFVNSLVLGSSNYIVCRMTGSKVIPRLFMNVVVHHWLLLQSVPHGISLNH